MKSPLEKRAAEALKGNGRIKSDDLVKLIGEIETAIEAADVAVAQVRERSLDLDTDPTRAHDAIAIAELSRSRLQAALPKLRSRLQQVSDAERAAAWKADYTTMKAKQAAAVKELTEVYPAAVNKLIHLMRRIADVDREIERVNSTAPYGEKLRIEGVEIAARGNLPSIAAQLRLPKLTYARDTDPGLAWPPREASPGAQLTPGMIMHPLGSGPGWHAGLEERDEKIKQAHERAAADAEARDRKRAEEEAAEIQKAKDADRAAYAARGWPT